MFCRTMNIRGWFKALLHSANAVAQWSSSGAPTVLRRDHLLRRATHLRIPGYAQRYPSARRRPAKLQQHNRHKQPWQPQRSAWAPTYTCTHFLLTSLRSCTHPLGITNAWSTAPGAPPRRYCQTTGKDQTMTYPPGVSQQTHVLATKQTPGHLSYLPGTVHCTNWPNKKITEFCTEAP